MLYDNAQLAQIYCRAWQATGKAFYRGVAEETLEYVLREMTSPAGGFCSAQDADSEGEEGRFFVWTPGEIEAVLGRSDAAVFCSFYDVTPAGNWEGHNILHVVKDADDVATEFGLTIEETARILDGGREKLFEAREKRIKPALDDKVLTSWNGLMIAAMADCGAAFDRADFRAAAARCAEFILSVHGTLDSGGRFRLLRTSRGGEAHLNGCLEDYALFADGLLRLYEADFDARWLERAGEIAGTILALFGDETPGGGGFFATSADHEALIQRPRDWDDNAVPSGNSVAVDVLLRLHRLTGREAYLQPAAAILRKLAPILEKHPGGFARMLGALDLYVSPPKEVAIVGDVASPEFGAMLEPLRRKYLPNTVIVAGDGASSAGIPLLEGRPALNGRPTAYVCENQVCRAPVTSPEELVAQLGA
jgi:uncharacterized protein YyaL (SSP411 family)